MNTLRVYFINNINEHKSLLVYTQLVRLCNFQSASQIVKVVSGANLLTRSESFTQNIPRVGYTRSVSGLKQKERKNDIYDATNIFLLFKKKDGFFNDFMYGLYI